MDTHKVVVEKMQSKRSLKARQLLRKGVGQTTKSTHVHAHGQVPREVTILHRRFDKIGKVSPDCGSGDREVGTDSIARLQTAEPPI